MPTFLKQLGQYLMRLRLSRQDALQFDKELARGRIGIHKFRFRLSLHLSMPFHHCQKQTNRFEMDDNTSWSPQMEQLQRHCLSISPALKDHNSLKLALYLFRPFRVPLPEAACSDLW